MPEQSPSQAAVAVLSSVDLSGLGDQLTGRVVERELLARLPGARVAHFAPLGWDRPSVADGGLVAAPLARPAGTTSARIVEAAHMSVVCPAFPLGIDLAELYSSPQAQWAEAYFAEGLGARLEEGHPVVLSGVRIVGKPSKALVAAVQRRAVVAVRDKVSRQLLLDAGVTTEIVVVPHPAVLLDKVADVAGLRARLVHLKPLGLVPPAGPYAVAPESFVDDIATVQLPVDAVVEDKLAILAGAKFVVATDEHTAAAAAGLGVPWVLLDPTGEETAPVLEFGDERQIVRSAANLAAGLEVPPRNEEKLAVLAEHFDRVAGLVNATADLPEADLVAENQALRAANLRLRERMVVERERMIKPIASLVGQNDDLAEQLAAEQAASADLARQNEQLAREVAERDRRLLEWENIKLVRWTNPIRRAYGKVRSLVK